MHTLRHLAELDAASQPIAPVRRRASPSQEATLADLEQLVAGEYDAVFVAGRFRVERALGHGGMATVYAAHDLDADRPVALKVLSEEGCARPPLRARFLREARLHARVRHSNVVELRGFGMSKTGVTYLAMERLVGEDLERILARENTLPWSLAREWLLQICAGLAAAHAAGVVHRDLKPSNCFMVDDDGRKTIRLIDFGIAAALDEPDSAAGLERLTLREQILGTPEYMSPEQARGERVDHRSDVYAAGLLLGQMLTGSLPFRAAASTAMLAAQIYEPPPPLCSLLPPGVRIPAALEPIYARALAKQPEHRFADIQAFAAALRAVELDGPALSRDSMTAVLDSSGPALAPSWRVCAATASLALVIGAIGALLWTGSARQPPRAPAHSPIVVGTHPGPAVTPISSADAGSGSVGVDRHQKY